MPRVKRSLGKFFGYFGISLFSSAGTTTELYPEEFKQRVKAEFCDPVLWQALNRTDHVVVGKYLKNNCGVEHLDTQWVIEMCRLRRYGEIRGMAEALQGRCLRRRNLYLEWHRMIHGEKREGLLSRIVATEPGENLSNKFW